MLSNQRIGCIDYRMYGHPLSRTTHRLPGHVYRGPWTYFVTICTRSRLPVLGTVVNGLVEQSATGMMVREEWMKTPDLRPGVVLDAYVVMPDHFHGLLTLPSDDCLCSEFVKSGDTRREGGIAPGYRPASLSALIGGFKAACTRRYWEIQGRKLGPLWQRDYYDRIVRDDIGLSQIRRYIEKNPARW